MVTAYKNRWQTQSLINIITYNKKMLLGINMTHMRLDLFAFCNNKIQLIRHDRINDPQLPGVSSTLFQFSSKAIF
jgi:hypothetical protein